jgi:TonB family protein
MIPTQIRFGMHSRTFLKSAGWTMARSESDIIEAEVPRANDNARYRIDFQHADTLQTLAHVTATFLPFRSGSQEGLWRLLNDVRDRLGSATHEYVDVAFPEGIVDCPAPMYDLDTPGLEPPEMHGGLRSLAQEVRYPHTALAAGIEGQVFVQIRVTEAGLIDCALINRGLPGGLNEEAMRTVLTLTFEPARLNGEAVSYRMYVPIQFRFR